MDSKDGLTMQILKIRGEILQKTNKAIELLYNNKGDDILRSIAEKLGRPIGDADVKKVSQNFWDRVAKELITFKGDSSIDTWMDFLLNDVVDTFKKREIKKDKEIKNDESNIIKEEQMDSKDGLTMQILKIRGEILQKRNEAIHLLYENKGKDILRRIAIKLVRPMVHPDVEEVSQYFWKRITKHLITFKGDSSIDTWMNSVLNSVVNTYKGREIKKNKEIKKRVGELLPPYSLATQGVREDEDKKWVDRTEDIIDIAPGPEKEVEIKEGVTKIKEKILESENGKILWEILWFRIVERYKAKEIKKLLNLTHYQYYTELLPELYTILKEKFSLSEHCAARIRHRHNNKRRNIKNEEKILRRKKK